jgi:hypothetical protein
MEMASRSQTRTEDIRQELAGLVVTLGALVDSLSAAAPTENQVWAIYAGAEKAVAKLKLRLGVERPGEFQEIPTSKKPEEFLTMSLERMNDGAAKMDERHLVESLESLRMSRNYLRGYLAERRKVRLRERRQAAAAKSSSASPS